MNLTHKYLKLSNLIAYLKVKPISITQLKTFTRVIL